VRQLVSSTSGTVTSNFDYDSYGNPLTTAGNTTPDAVDFLFGYAGGVYDGELAAYNGGSGLDYFVHRYYNSRTGQFTSIDPAGADVLNPYHYVGNDPVNATDPRDL
jgi:RHS repeat-associated protein